MNKNKFKGSDFLYIVVLSVIAICFCGCSPGEKENGKIKYTKEVNNTSKQAQKISKAKDTHQKNIEDISFDSVEENNDPEWYQLYDTNNLLTLNNLYLLENAPVASQIYI